MLYFIFTIDGDWEEYFDVNLSEEERAELLEFAWTNQILPLLEEYFYGQRDKLVELLAPFRSEVGTEAKAQQKEEDEFDIGRLESDDLLAALARLAEREIASAGR